MTPPLPPDTNVGRRPGMQPADVPMRHRRPWRDAALRIRNWRVRRKLTMGFIIPPFAFILGGGLDTARAAARAPIIGVVHELQRERDRTAGFIVVAGRNGRDAEGARTLSTALDADIA